MGKELDEILKTTKEMGTRLEKAEARQKEWDEAKENMIAMGNYRTTGLSMNSDESRAMRYYGCSHPKDLLQVNVGHPDYENVPPELKFLVLDIKKTIDVARMTAQVCLGEPTDRVRKTDKQDDIIPGNVKGIFSTYYGKHVLAPKLKALGTGSAGEGAEWVPTVISSQFIEEFELERMLARQFISLNMPSNPFQLPVQDGTTEARIQAEGATISQANFGTAVIEFDAVKLAEFTVLPEELNEDSAPNILALKRREVSEAISRGIEQAIMNGDDDGAHFDADTQAGGADLAAKSMSGLRKLALANSATTDFVNAVASVAKLRDMRAAMGKFGVNPRDLVWVVSPKIINQFLALDEVTTVEKFGPQATILKGTLQSLDGIGIVTSEFARDDLNASGVEDGVTTDRSQVMLVNRNRFMLGVRRPIRVRATFDPVPPNDRWLCVAWWRGDFQGHEQDADEASVQLGINLA